MAGASIVIADDDVLLREGIAAVLTRAGYEVAGQAGDAQSLLDVARRGLTDDGRGSSRVPGPLRSLDRLCKRSSPTHDA
jgi:hypothetical protein